jgi:hypothetical protein
VYPVPERGQPVTTNRDIDPNPSKVPRLPAQRLVLDTCSLALDPPQRRGSIVF